MIQTNSHHSVVKRCQTLEGIENAKRRQDLGIPGDGGAEAEEVDDDGLEIPTNAVHLGGAGPLRSFGSGVHSTSDEMDAN